MDSGNSVERYEHDLAALNEALVLSLVRQHELTETAELLNVKLQAEIVVRQRAEEALIYSEKLASVGRMAAVLAHEINNPLEAVMNVIYLAQISEGLPDSVRPFLMTADDELKRIAHITRQTLGFYREPSPSTTFTIDSILDSIIDLLKAQVISKGALIDKQCDPGIRITAFEGELRQVLSNLLKNSLEAIPKGGKVTMRAALATNYGTGAPSIRITIADNGQGISHEVAAQLFKPFFTTKGSVGNGLGLWVSKQIIEKHGGSIRVRSHTNTPRQGTTFSMLFPVEQA